jgi:hypothetical protein
MHSTEKRLITAAAVLLVAASIAAAKPNLSGEWKLNLAKSDFGDAPAPASVTQKVVHDDPNLALSVHQSSDMGDLEFEAKYTTDGKECANMIRENPTTSVLKWDGDTLLFDIKGKFGDDEFTMKDKWTLSEDGKVLTINRHFSSSFGEGDQKLIFDKQ